VRLGGLNPSRFLGRARPRRRGRPRFFPRRQSEDEDDQETHASYRARPRRRGRGQLLSLPAEREPHPSRTLALSAPEVFLRQPQAFTRSGNPSVQPG
jgi:hypothetical protein